MRRPEDTLCFSPASSGSARGSSQKPRSPTRQGKEKHFPWTALHDFATLCEHSSHQLFPCSSEWPLRAEAGAREGAGVWTRHRAVLLTFGGHNHEDLQRMHQAQSSSPHLQFLIQVKSGKMTAEGHEVPPTTIHPVDSGHPPILGFGSKRTPKGGGHSLSSSSIFFIVSGECWRQS